MKSLIFLFLISISVSVWAAQYRIYKVGDRVIYVPLNNNKKDELKGFGVDFVGKVIIKEIIDPQTNSVSKKAYFWISGCGETEIIDPKAVQELKNGDMIRVKQEGYKKCSIKSWERF